MAYLCHKKATEDEENIDPEGSGMMPVTEREPRVKVDDGKRSKAAKHL
jgi:hypothetical protein